VPPVRRRLIETLLELVALLGVEQPPHGLHGAAAEDLRVERGGDQVLLGDGQRGHDLTVGEVRGAPRGRHRDALGADPELGGGTVRVERLRVLRAGHRGLRGQRDHGHPERFRGLGGRGAGRVAHTHVDRGAEGEGDQQDEDQRLPGEAAAHGRAAAYGRGVVGEALLGGELLEAGSADERFVEDDGSVFVLSTAGGALGSPLRWVSWPAHTWRVGLPEPR
jgi:hypothetical protein